MAAPEGLVDAVKASAERLGVNPSDLLTSISYETGGSLDPWQKGPTTQWGQHRGLIQWGEPQRQKYGVTKDMPVADQMKAVEAYLTDAGVKPGSNMLDIYSAINSGRVGNPNASDANNGGAPGTVADKVASMAGHRMRANALLGLDRQTVDQGGQSTTPAPQTATAAPAGGVPMSLAPSPGGADVPPGEDPLNAALQGLQAGAAPQQEAQPMPQMQMDPIRYYKPPNLAKARALAAAMQNRSLG